MDRNELTLAVAGALLAAVLLGWLIGAIAARLAGRGPATLAEAHAAIRAAEARAAAAEAETARLRAELEDLRAALEDGPG